MQQDVIDLRVGGRLTVTHASRVESDPRRFVEDVDNPERVAGVLESFL